MWGLVEKMRRVGHLFDDFCSFPHLLKSYEKARKGSGHSREFHEFSFFLEQELIKLSEELNTQSYVPGPFRYFRIYDPKERTISVAPFRDRVVHHALVGILEPIFENCFIFDSYATRKGKGTHKAISRAQLFLQQTTWFFKADIDKFFDSVEIEILLGIIQRKIKDPRLLHTIQKILQNGSIKGKGLPIGNLTSQFFANVYLNPLDHFVKQLLGVKYYLRYMDDFVMFHSDKGKLKSYRKEVEMYLKDNLQLQLKYKACFLNQRMNGLSFLGTRIFPNLIRIHPQNLRRMKRRLLRRQLEYEKGVISEEKWLASFQSSWAHLSQMDTLSLRRNLLPLFSGDVAHWR